MQRTVEVGMDDRIEATVLAAEDAAASRAQRGLEGDLAEIVEHRRAERDEVAAACARRARRRWITSGRSRPCPPRRSFRGVCRRRSASLPNPGPGRETSSSTIVRWPVLPEMHRRCRGQRAVRPPGDAGRRPPRRPPPRTRCARRQRFFQARSERWNVPTYGFGQFQPRQLLIVHARTDGEIRHLGW